MINRRATRVLPWLIVLMSAVACRCDPSLNQTYGHAAWVSQAALSVEGDEATLDFGPVLFGRSKALTVEWSNDGNGPLTLRASGATAPFERLELEAQVATASRASWTITFTPTTNGSSSPTYSEDVVISTEGTRPPQSLVLHLRGTGYSIDCELPESVEFGAVLVGERAPYSLQFLNPSATTRVVDLPAPHGSDGPSFTWSPTALTVAPDSREEATLTFQPTEPREYFALASLQVADSCPVATMTLHGTGVSQLLSWNPVEVDCGWLPLGHRRAVNVSFYNHSRGVVTLSAFATTGDAEAPGQAIQLPPEEETLVEFVCRPQTLGPSDAVISFATSLPSQPVGAVTLKMKGGGPEIDVQPAALNFGRVAWSPTGATTTTRQLTVRNLGARPPDAGSDANLHLLGTPWLAFVSRGDGGVSEDDVALSPAPLDVVTGLATNQRTTADVRLTPPQPGELRFALGVSSDDGSNPHVMVEAHATAVEAPPCQLLVTPATVDFGVLALGESRHAAITMTNQGTNTDEVCFLSAIDLASDAESQGFSLDGGRIESVELGPQQQLQLTVSGVGTSVDGSKISALTFEVNTPGDALRTILLRSVTAPKCIEIYPAPLDFGTVPVGCRSVRSISIYNTCIATESLIGINTNNIYFSVDAGSFDIHESESITVPVIFAPSDAGHNDAILSVSLLSGLRLVDATGVGAVDTTIKEEFLVPAQPQLDVLFTTTHAIGTITSDAGAHFYDSAPRMLSNIVGRLFDAGYDFHAGAIVASWDTTVPGGFVLNPWGFGGLVRPLDGGLEDGYVTSSTQDREARFEDVSRLAIFSAIDPAHPVPFESSTRALAFPLRSTLNTGFRREGVSLGVVSFGHFFDFSGVSHPHGSRPSPYIPFPVSFYEARFQAIAARAPFSFNALRRIYDAGTPDCGLAALVEPLLDDRIGEMVDWSGGVDLDLCSNLDDVSSAVTTSLIATTRRFSLRGVPDAAAPMVVSVDGAALTTDEWTYLSAANAIELAVFPPPLATVEVSYYPICE